MAFVPVILISALVLGLIAGSIDSAIKKGASGLKVMLLGINITLVGGIIAVDANSNLSGFEYLIVLSGLIISFVGLNKKE